MFSSRFASTLLAHLCTASAPIFPRFPLQRQFVNRPSAGSLPLAPLLYQYEKILTTHEHYSRKDKHTTGILYTIHDNGGKIGWPLHLLCRTTLFFVVFIFKSFSFLYFFFLSLARSISYFRSRYTHSFYFTSIIHSVAPKHWPFARNFYLEAGLGVFFFTTL